MTILSTLLSGVEAHIARNLPEYLTFLGALAIASVCTMPEKIPYPLPSVLQDWWTWVRDALQTAVPAARKTVVTVPSSTVHAPSASLVSPASPVPPTPPTPPVSAPANPTQPETLA